MPDGTNESTTPETPETPETETTTFAPITSQADLDKVINARIAREKAKYADYEPMKKRLAEIEDAGRSEVERATLAATSASEEAKAAQRELSILRAASKHGVPADYVDLIDGADDDAIDAKAAKVAALAVAKGGSEQTPPPPGQYKFADPGQGGEQAPEANAVKEAFARQLFQL